MTYHNKLLLKKAARLIAFILLFIVIILLIAFLYLGRYLVYDKNGAHFSFRDTASSALEDYEQTIAVPESAVLVTGDAVVREVDEDDATAELAAADVNGLFVDYATLSDDSALNAVDFTGYNTVVMEMRKKGSEIVNTTAVQNFITRAKTENIHLKAMMACLDDRDFALENMADALHIQGGALWVVNHTYYLNPGSETTQAYLEGMINSLANMGFEEVILDNFQFPSSESIVDDTGDQTREEVLISAFNKIKNSVSCTLGLLIPNMSTGHQAFDAADHLYVYASSGSNIKTYMENHQNYYIVLMTDSHDTRFDDYGKIEANESLADIEEITQQEEADAEAAAEASSEEEAQAEDGDAETDQTAE